MFEKTNCVVFVFALVFVSLVAGFGYAAEEFYEGTWFGEISGLPIRIDLSNEPDGLSGTATLLDHQGRPLHYLLDSARRDGDKLYLELSGAGGRDFPGVIRIQLRLPRNELVGKITMGGPDPLSLTVSQDAPELASRFVGVKPPSYDNIEEARASNKDARERASCANNLKQLGLVFKMFSNESRGGRFPGLDPRAGNLMFTMKEVYPEYLTDPNIMKCPANKDLQQADRSKDSWSFDNSDYWYLGHAVNDEVLGLAFIEAYHKAADQGEPLDQDFKGDSSSQSIYRLREGIERFFITDINNPAGSAMAQSRIPVLIERPGNHSGGANVLFLDGHVEYIKYPGRFPMTEAFIRSLRSLDDLKATSMREMTARE